MFYLGAWNGGKITKSWENNQKKRQPVRIASSFRFDGCRGTTALQA